MLFGREARKSDDLACCHAEEANGNTERKKKNVVDGASFPLCVHAVAFPIKNEATDQREVEKAVYGCEKELHMLLRVVDTKLLQASAFRSFIIIIIICICMFFFFFFVVVVVCGGRRNRGCCCVCITVKSEANRLRKARNS